MAPPTVTGTPEPSRPDAELDLAYLTFQPVLAGASIELAELAATNLEHAELREFAEAEIAEAETDQATLDAWMREYYPDSEVETYQLFATIEQARMKLDLPAGEGGLDSFAAVAGIGQICQSDGPFDDVYLMSAMDLAQRQIDLAQVAVVNSTNPDIVEFATAVIERETIAIGKLLTWQNAWVGDAATPAE